MSGRLALPKAIEVDPTKVPQPNIRNVKWVCYSIINRLSREALGKEPCPDEAIKLDWRLGAGPLPVDDVCFVDEKVRPFGSNKWWSPLPPDVEVLLLQIRRARIPYSWSTELRSLDWMKSSRVVHLLEEVVTAPTLFLPPVDHAIDVFETPTFWNELHKKVSTQNW